MADGGNRQIRCKKFGHQLLQLAALQILAHTPRPMTAGQQQAIKIFAPRLRPRQWRLIGRILDHRCVVPPRVRVGPHQTADGSDVL